MWRMLQQETADDYVLATGIMVTVREFVDKAFTRAGITLRWEGFGENEKGIDTASGKTMVEVDPKYFRPAEVELLVGDASKAEKELGWKPTYTLQQLVEEMVDEDIKLFKRDQYLLKGGHDIMSYDE